MFTNRHYHTPQHRPQWWTPPSIGGVYIYITFIVSDTGVIPQLAHRMFIFVITILTHPWIPKTVLVFILCFINFGQSNMICWFFSMLDSAYEALDLLLRRFWSNFSTWLIFFALTGFLFIIFDTFYYSKHLGHTFYNFNLSKKV